MGSEITLAPFNGRKRRYKSLAAARRGMHAILGDSVRLDPDGYLVGRNGECLFVIGVPASMLIEVSRG